jgi:hypothetical protein
LVEASAWPANTFYECEMPMIDAWIAPLRNRIDLAARIDESLL